MKYTTFVAFLLLSTQALSADLSTALQAIESEWASIYYKLPKSKQEEAFSALLKKAEALSSEFPNEPEPLFWEAVITATNAELQDGFTALKAIHQAKDLLQQAINMNPKTANGSAYVTLATLYYMSPKWPIAFGNDERAEQLFKEALSINPNSIDANYFYGDFLLNNNQQSKAQKYFAIAASLPSRQEQRFADDQLKTEAKMALANVKNRKITGIKSAFLALFNSASLK